MAEYKNRIVVNINDQQYTIIGKEDPEHIRYVANLVDQKIKEIGELSPGLDTSRKSVLTAVNVMDEYVKLKQEYDALIEDMDKQGK